MHHMMYMAGQAPHMRAPIFPVQQQPMPPQLQPPAAAAGVTAAQAGMQPLKRKGDALTGPVFHGAHDRRKPPRTCRVAFQKVERTTWADDLETAVGKAFKRLFPAGCSTDKHRVRPAPPPYPPCHHHASCTTTTVPPAPPPPPPHHPYNSGCWSASSPLQTQSLSFCCWDSTVRGGSWWQEPAGSGHGGVSFLRIVRDLWLTQVPVP